MILFPLCYAPVEEKRTLNLLPTHRVEIINNSPELAVKLWHETVNLCGISNDLFKRYVQKTLADKTYEYVTYEWRTLLTGEKCISKAYVYYEKKKKTLVQK